ncbi:MAG: NAD(P)-dependent oxidoreductase [Phycisphaerales bacterium]|nr:NAD(P)-dependent oxidoreductase [Phycisphaerales bacterium]
MLIAVTGATGFLGRYIVKNLVEQGHRCRCWHRPRSDRSNFEGTDTNIEWTPGSLEETDGFENFCRDADAIVHSALYRPAGLGFRAAGREAFIEFVRVNLLGSLSLIETARRIEIPRFVFISTCAVHEIILPDRPLDETHPLWSTSHYGAHKAAIEQFVHSYGHGEGWPICAIRPTGIYGTAHPVTNSRWYNIVRQVCRGESFHSDRGGKEVHAADVAKAVGILLHADADQIKGHSFNCYDRYVAEQTVASLAREISGSHAEVGGANQGPKNQIDTTKIRRLGMVFGGETRLRQTIERLVAASTS